MKRRVAAEPSIGHLKQEHRIDRNRLKGKEFNPEEESSISAQTPLRRIGRPEDVADVILLLASEQAHWLTGQLLYVGGGWRMHQ